MAASGRAKGIRHVFFPVRNTLANYDFIGLMIVQSVALAAPIAAWGRISRSQLRLLATLWLPGIAGLALTLTQSHGDGRGIVLIVAGMAAAQAQRFSTKTEPADGELSFRRAMSSLALIFACLLFVGPHGKSYWTLYSVSLNPGPPQFPPGHLRDLYVGPYSDLGAEYLPAMREALDLLSENCRPSQSLQFFGGCNIFPFATGMRSPKESMIFWCGMSTFSESRHPRTEEFDDTDFILCLKDQYISMDTWLSWKPIYSYFISSHYQTCGVGKYFVLLRRRQMTSSSE
jgi:hypothetical protein